MKLLTAAFFGPREDWIDSKISTHLQIRMLFYKNDVLTIGSLWFHISLLGKYVEATTKLPKFCQMHNMGDVKCETKHNPDRVFCVGNFDDNIKYWKVKIVYLCLWVPVYIIPEKILKTFPYAQKLAVVKGNVDEFLTDFPRSIYLEHLILSELNISHLRPNLFDLLENLKYLDLSRNRLKFITPDLVKNQISLSKITLTDNPLDCSADVKWILNKSITSKIHNKNLLLCGDENYLGKPVYFVGLLIKKMEKNCPDDICSCAMNNIVWNRQRSHLIPVITVNCTEKGLTDLPNRLPVNTTVLVLNNNNITNLVPLIHNKMYSTITDIYLDYNQIKSIDVLEGAVWLKTFRVLSLRGNELSQLPVYALDNAFEKNTNMAKIYLGNNPWKCDCSFTPDFQSFLIKYGSLVKDKYDVKCSEQVNDENSNRLIVKLSTKSLCQKLENGINPLDVLSIVLAILILLIIGKFLYDWWTFKRTGKLPWIVTKIP